MMVIDDDDEDDDDDDDDGDDDDDDDDDDETVVAVSYQVSLQVCRPGHHRAGVLSLRLAPGQQGGEDGGGGCV